MLLSVGYTIVARLIRLLQVTRLTNRSEEMSGIIMTIIKSIPCMINIFLLLSLLYFIFGIAGYHLFYIIDIQYGRSQPMAVLTLFPILTLESWTGIIQASININAMLGFLFYFFYYNRYIYCYQYFIAANVRKSEIVYKRIESKNMELVTQIEILFELLD